MRNPKTIISLVEEILTKYPQTRNSDGLLWLKVLEVQAAEKGCNLRMLSVPYFLPRITEMGFVGFETVRRARQKVQQHHPELAASEAVEGFRAENEKQFRAFARGDV